MNDLDVVAACMRKLGGENFEFDNGQVRFTIANDSLSGFAYVKDGGRLRGSVWIGINEPHGSFDEANAWASAQPSPLSGLLQVLDTAEMDNREEGDYAIRLLFERPLDPEMIDPTDPLVDEAIDLFLACAGVSQGEGTPGSQHRSFVAEDPVRLAPSGAWLMIGDQHAALTDDDIRCVRENAARGIFEDYWTAAKQTQQGDLLFWYLVAPISAVKYVARAVGAAFFMDVGEVDGEWQGRQWWCHYTTPIEIEPVPLSTLQTVMGPTVMKGRGGRYLRPEHVAVLVNLIRPAKASDEAELAAVLQPVTGSAELGEPSTYELDEWRAVAAGPLKLEAEVERHLTEPLLRFISGEGSRLSVEKAFRVGRRIADYAILQGNRPAFVVEVKLRVRKSPAMSWRDCKDFQQASDYGTQLGCPAILMDAFEVHLIPVGAETPAVSWRRSEFTQNNMSELRALLNVAD